MATRKNHFKVYVDSRKRLSETDANFTYAINLPSGVRFTHVVCLNALIPKSYWLVQSGYNTMQLQEGNSIVTVSVAVGSYTLTSWMNQLSTVLTAMSPNNLIYTVTYPSATSAVLPEKAMLLFSCSSSTIAPILSFQQNLFEPCGFLQFSINPFTLANGTNILSSTCVIKLQAEDRLLISSSLVTNPGDNDILVSINSTAYVNYSSIAYTNYYPDYNRSELRNRSGIYTFSIHDENNVVLDLNGLNWNATLDFFEEVDELGKIYNLIEAFMQYLVHDSADPKPTVPEIKQLEENNKENINLNQS